MKKNTLAYLNVAATACFCALVTGCATDPSQLRTPPELTCIDIKEPLAFTGHYGLFNMEWTTRLERGPYWSEKMDDKGIFFRAPPGGVSTRNAEGRPFPGQPIAVDGGFYLPKDPKEPVTIYKYFTVAAVPIEVPSEDQTCGNLAYTKEPASQKVSLVAFAAGGAVGGAAGGMIGRSRLGSGMSYGQSAGAGAAGGAIAGLLVAAMINSEIGKITGGLPIEDQAFREKLRALGANREPLKLVASPRAASSAASDAASGATSGAAASASPQESASR